MRTNSDSPGNVTLVVLFKFMLIQLTELLRPDDLEIKLMFIWHGESQWHISAVIRVSVVFYNLFKLYFSTH